MSLNFNKFQQIFSQLPSIADPPFHVWTSDEETSMAPYCVEEEEEQWLHPWFRVHAANPPALALCPSLLKLLRLKLLLCSIHDKETTKLLNLRIWPAHFQEIHNSYQIVSRNGPRALFAIHHDKNVLRPAQWANGDHHRRLERRYMHGGMDRGWFAR